MSRFTWYLLSVALGALATGVQIVVLPWLAAGALQLPADQVGWVQSAVLLPGLALMLVGGAFADGAGSQRFLSWMYLGLSVCHGLMFWWLSADQLQLGLLMIYALALGVVNAFLQPLRDKVLPRLIDVTDAGAERQTSRLQSSVVKVNFCVYVAQAAGVTLAGQMQWLTLEGVVALQAIAVVLAAVILMGVFARTETSAPDLEVAADRSYSIAEGLTFVRHHPVLRHLMLLVGFNGFMHIGVFVVALPLLSRDVYQQDAFLFASLQLAFVVGNVVATIALLRRGAVAQPGRAVLFCLLYAGMIMLAIAARPTETGLFMLIFAWGVVAGVSASLGKTLLQQQVEESVRGRVLSIYQLALFGGAPLGALVCGYAVKLQGALSLFQVGGVVTLALFGIYLFVKPLWHMDESTNQ